MPSIGNELAVFNRRYFLSGALLAFAIVSSYAFAEYPYDNLCDASGEVGVSGTVPVEFFNGTAGVIDVPGTNSPAAFCQMSYLRLPGFNFPARPSVQQKSQGEWMSESQAMLIKVFGWSSLAALILFIIIVFGNAIINAVRSIFSGEVQQHTVDQKIDFSAVNEISGKCGNRRQGGEHINSIYLCINKHLPLVKFSHNLTSPHACS